MSRYYNRVCKAEMLEYMRDKNINYMEASDAFARMGRRPLTRTMKAVRKEVERRSYLQFRAEGGRMIDVEKYTDAPLILEDYKRLRKDFKGLGESLKQQLPHCKDKEMIEWIIEKIQEMIE